MAQLPNLLIGLLVHVVTNFINAVILMGYILNRYLKKKKNYLDITIFEFTRNGIQIRNEIGRREFKKDKGTITFTVRKFGDKIKDNLGYNIRDDDLYISTMGNNRKYLLVAMKDKLIATFQEALTSYMWSEEEKNILSSVLSKVSKPGVVKIDHIPEKLNLNPVIAEQTRFMLDVEKDRAEVYKSDERATAKKMLYASAGIFIFTLIISLVIIVLVINQSPTLAQTVASAPPTTPSPIPGVGILPG